MSKIPQNSRTAKPLSVICGPHLVSKQFASCKLAAYMLILCAPLHISVYIPSIKKYIVEKKVEFYLHITYKHIEIIQKNIQICFLNEHLLQNNKIVTITNPLCNRNTAVGS
jgi:hypothetical protein